MLNAKLTLNGLDIHLSGDKTDLVDFITQASLSLSPKSTVSIKVREPVQIKPTQPKTPTPSFTNEQMIEMYEWLNGKSGYEIRQFSIIRGGKIKPKTFTACFVYNTTTQKYEFESPHYDDTFKKSFSIQDAVSGLKKSDGGFRLVNKAASMISKNISTLKDMIGITSRSDGVIGFSAPSFPSDHSDENVVFNDYDAKSKVQERLNTKTAKSKYKSLITKMVKVGDNFLTEDINFVVRKSHIVSRPIACETLKSLAKDGVIRNISAKTWQRLV